MLWILWGALAGGAVLFVVNAVAWMGLHHHTVDFRGLSNAKGVEDALRAAGATAGLYQLPHHSAFEKGMCDPAFAQRFEQGPNALLVVTPPGPCMRPSTFLAGFLLNVAEAAGVALAVHYASGTLAGLFEVVWLSAMLGLLVHGGPVLAQCVWMGFPWRHGWKTLADGVVGFALTGVVLHFLRP